MLVVVTRKYRAADPVARRQIKWAVFGIYCVALPPATAALLSALDPRLGWLWWPSYWVAPLAPLTFVISVLRFNLVDIDRVFSATASYNILAVLLGAGGADLASGQREVSVLFVDIRGYTGFAEDRKAEEIFSTVNRYTEAVSRIVEEHAGSVVEFNGDGMMAIFGAPRKLAHKERAAVEAGREIVQAVGALPVEDPSGGETTLSVGVGIATGETFVGNIQAVDRMIWTAIGNTTNLAARLQHLTRELDASMVIDSLTRERSRSAAGGFEKRPDVPIRGRRETQDVYLLPMHS
jgi:adenylate cyclase